MIKTEYEEINGKLDFLARAYTTLHNEIIRRRLPEDDFALNQISKFLHEISKIANQFSKETKERETFRMPDEFVDLIGTMRFIAKRMDSIEKRFKELDGLDFKHNVKITVDSSSMDTFNNRPRNFDPYSELLEYLSLPDRKILIHRYGLYGDKKTMRQIAHLIGFKSESVVKSRLHSALRKLRAIEITHLKDTMPDGELKMQIFGKSYDRIN